jgi:hypothetical protein
MIGDFSPLVKRKRRFVVGGADFSRPKGSRKPATPKKRGQETK